MAQNDPAGFFHGFYHRNLVPVKIWSQKISAMGALERSWVGADEDLSQGLPAPMCWKPGSHDLGNQQLP